ncbi:MAG: DUF998 domain-containing protein [Promethearchaeota archaeon]
MDGESTILNRVFQVIPPGIFGLLSVLVGVSGDIISASLYPGFSITKNMISDLGVGPGGIFFNFGVIFSGILAIPYVIHLNKTVLEPHRVKPWIFRLALFGSVISSIALSLIGVFPAYQNNFTILLIHGIIATICYIGVIIYLTIYGRLILRDERFSNGFGYFTLIVACLFIIVLLTWLPLIQWIANVGIIIWTTLAASYLLHKKI